MSSSDLETPDEGWLSLHDVWQSYGPLVHALRGVSLAVRRGEYVALTGPSGSGKSTMLHVLSGLRTPTSGTRTICGITQPSPSQATALCRSDLGIIFQSFHLLPYLTALDNVLLGALYTGLPLSERRRRAEESLESVGLAPRAGHLPRELSGGEQQRVAIARALIRTPTTLLADEPTGNLDSHSGEEVLSVLDRVHAAGTTIVLVTHSDQAAARAERRVELRDGRIVSGDGVG